MLLPCVIWVMVAIFGTSLVTLSYLGFKVAFLEDVRQESFERGRQEVITGLRGYFAENPESYQAYEAWRLKEKEINPAKTEK